MPRYRLTEAELREYREHGHVLIKDFLSPEELELWRRGVDQAVDQRGPLGGGAVRLPVEHPNPAMNTEEDASQWKVSADVPASSYEKVFTQRLNLWMTNEIMRDLMLCPGLGEMVTTLAGEHMPECQGMRIWHDQALIKEPWGNATAWHIDNPNWSYTSIGAITMWVALDEVTMKNGALHFLPGSWREAELGRTAGGFGDMNKIFEDYPEWADRTSKVIELPPGGASFHSGMIAHAAGPNMTPGRRRAMTCAYMPDGSRFNGKQNVLPTPYYQSLQVQPETPAAHE